jgi:hypothetical protein
MTERPFNIRIGKVTVTNTDYPWARATASVGVIENGKPYLASFLLMGRYNDPNGSRHLAYYERTA